MTDYGRTEENTYDGLKVILIKLRLSKTRPDKIIRLGQSGINSDKTQIKPDKSETASN